ncbi:SLBB domain-containing protein [Planktomarina temperata]|nr:SLBB domain-containing protein [Planktomarina temperata]
MMPRLLAFALVLSASMTTPASSQTAEQQMFLQANPGLAQQLQRQSGAQKSSGPSEGAGVPTSGEIKVLNADDAIADPSLLIQSRASNAREESVIERYYSILTRDVLPIYGAAEFGQSQDTQLLFFNTMGKDYRLAAGDVLRVTLRGLTESDASYKIGRDGNLILPALAPFSAAGLSIAKAETKLLDVLRYDDASATVYMSLDTARLITVQVSGAVKTPRTVAVPAYTPLSRVLAYAGGIKPTGSLRNIVLRDRDGNVNQVDFYDFLQSPEGANDPLVTDSSRVFVGNQGNTIAAIGFVARPGIYELPEGTASLPVGSILELTGTRILPPGVKLEALYFDESGLAQSREVSRSSILKAGEVLSIRFLPTRLTDVILVKGAVLEEYQIATGKALSVGEVLRGGAILSEDASRDVALVIGENETSKVIDLGRAFEDPKFTLSPGDILHVFTPTELRDIARANVNSSDSDVLLGFVEAESAELFLNGSRISFIPLSAEDAFKDILRPFYRLTPQTSLDLAILEDDSGSARAVSLRSLLLSSAPFVVSAGDKIHLFENQFLAISADVLTSQPTQEIVTQKDDEIVTQKDDDATWTEFSQLITRAGVMRVFIDDSLRALLPSSENPTLAFILDTLGFDGARRLSDLVSVERLTSKNRKILELKSIAGNLEARLPEKTKSVSLYTQSGKEELLNKPDSAQFEELTSKALNLYINDEQVQLAAPSDLLNPGSEISQELSSQDIYPLFAIHEYFDDTEQFWRKDAVSLSDLRSELFANKLEPGDRITAFTRNFLFELVNPGSGSDALQQLIGLQIAGSDIEEEVQSESQRRLGEQRPANAEQLAQKNASAPETFAYLQFILSVSRYVSGAVERPGYYPVAGSVTLSQLLSATGDLTQNADTMRVEVIKQKVNGGKIVADEVKRFDLTKSDASSLRLLGRYSVNVPAFINDVATGLVTLAGEVQRPGEYLIARDETLHDLIARAGGLTGVAYPFGAVFTRESLKDSQRESNVVLADQLEQSVLQVASSDVEGAGEQVKAVLKYAGQLRSQDVTGRLSVNVALSDVSGPVYLQGGDTLTIPKRPSHVSVIGSVQKDTVASYSADKRLSAYLAAAGGSSRIADLKRAYILLPNGESTAADEDSIIPPGAVIVVPPKTNRLTVLGLTDLVSRVLGNIATSVLAINNVR